MILSLLPQPTRASRRNDIETNIWRAQKTKIISFVCMYQKSVFVNNNVYLIFQHELNFAVKISCDFRSSISCRVNSAWYLLSLECAHG